MSNAAPGLPRTLLAHGARVDVRGAAPEAFGDAELTDGGVTGVPSPSAIFVGGGLTQDGLLDACIRSLPERWSAGRQHRHR